MSDPTREIKALKARIELLESIILEGKPYTPGQDEFERALEAMLDGNMEPLTLYLRRGGVIPKPEAFIAARGGLPS